MANSIIIGAPGTSRANATQDVIKPAQAWAGAYDSNRNLPSPVNVSGRPWDLPRELKWLMLRDSQVFAGYMLWKTAVLVDGIQIYPSSNTKDSNGKPSKQREKIASMIADASLWNLNNIRGGLHVKLLQLLDCCIWGYKAASQVYREQKIGRWKGKLVLDRLRIMANDDYNVRCDEFGVVVGLQPAQESGDNNIYNINKFLYACFRPYDDHPLGTDILWPIYEDFYAKKMMAPERMANASQFGSPSLVVEAPEGVQTVKLLDQWGNAMTHPALNANGDPNPKGGQEIEIPINHHLMAGLKNFDGNGSAMVLPYSAKLNLLQAQGNGEVFRFYNDDSNMGIIKGIFFTTDWTENQKYSSRGKSQVAANISQCSLMDGKKMLSDIIEEYVLENVIRMNEWDGIAGEELLDLVPEVTFGNIESGILASIFNSVSALWSTGFFDNSQRAEICRKLALPMPDPNAPDPRLQQGKTPAGTVAVKDEKDGDKQDEDEEEEE
jgi:hypothetical protein